MPTKGQAMSFRSNVNSFVAFSFIAAYSLGIGLVLWFAIFHTNPLANAMVKSMTTSTEQ